jgi:sugar phosphate isomerase/epimerase
MRFAYNTLVYGSEPAADSIARLARFGYDGVEFVGEPGKFDVGEVKELLAEHDIAASSICAIFTPARDLVSRDAAVRHDAVEYIKWCVDLAADLGAEAISTQVAACMKIHPEDDRSTELDRAVVGLQQAGEAAGEKGIRLALEPWNRYETYLINRLEQSLEVVERVNLDSVGCMADLFHMAIEEVDIAAALRLPGEKLYHVHFADSDRAAPGHGHTDFRPSVEALLDMNYAGYVSFELLPASGDPFLKIGQAREFFDEYTEQAITYTKRIVGEVKQARR